MRVLLVMVQCHFSIYVKTKDKNGNGLSKTIQNCTNMMLPELTDGAKCIS